MWRTTWYNAKKLSLKEHFVQEKGSMDVLHGIVDASKEPLFLSASLKMLSISRFKGPLLRIFENFLSCSV